MVPVLSEKMTETLPSSSGIVLFLATAPISWSPLIPLEKNSFEKSRLSLREIGMMVDKRRMYLKVRMKGLLNLQDPRRSRREASTMRQKSCLEILLSSPSNHPTFSLPSLMFCLILVSGPMYITTARASAEQRTQVCQRVCWRSRLWEPWSCW